MKFNSLDGKSASSILSLIILVAALVSSIIITHIIIKYKAKKMLESAKFIKKFGCITEGLKVSCFVGAYWNILIIIRWTLTTVILLVLTEHNEIQILTLLFLSIFY